MGKAAAEIRMIDSVDHDRVPGIASNVPFESALSKRRRPALPIAGET